MTEEKNLAHVGEHFATIPEWILYHPDLSGNAVRLYGVLSRYVGGRGGKAAFPGIDRLIEETASGERSVRASKKELIAVGALKEARRGQGRTNLYWIAGVGSGPITQVLDPAKVQDQEPAEVSVLDPAKVQDEPEKGEPEKGEPEKVLLPPITAHARVAVPTVAAPSAAEMRRAHFAAFWDKYPNVNGRKRNKAKTGKMFDKAHIEDAARLSAGFRWWINHWENPNQRQYVPSPEVFFNQRWWDMDPDTAEQSASPRGDSKQDRAVTAAQRIAARAQAARQQEQQLQIGTSS